MKADEAEAKFRSADEFYRAGRYKAALAALDELDRAYPNERHVMLPRARCLHKLGRRDEAIALCDDLVNKHNYRKAEKFKKRLLQEFEPSPTAVGAPPPEEGFGDFSLSALNIDLEQQTPEESAFNKPRAVSSSRSINWNAVYSAGVIVLAIGLFVARTYVRSQRDNDESLDSETVAAAEAQSLAAPLPAPTSTADGTIDTSRPPEIVRFQNATSEDGVTVNASVEFRVWTDAGSYDTFKQKYAACERAAARFDSPLGTVEYRVLGNRGGRCMIEVRYEKFPTADLSDKKMTCQCDPAMEFERVIESFNPGAIANGRVLCTGPLADAMRKLGSAR